MGNSSLTGIEPAPIEPPGREVDVLGPSDSSDSGSDSVGTPDGEAATDAAGTGEQRSAEHDEPARDGADIGVDRVFSADARAAGDSGDEGDDAAEPVDGDENEDPDLSFIDRARADDAPDDVEDEEPDASTSRLP